MPDTARENPAVPNDLDSFWMPFTPSEAVDTALKIALANHNARGDGQRRILVACPLADWD